MSLYVVANTAAPDSTRNLQTWTLLQEAAQWSGVLQVEEGESGLKRLRPRRASPLPLSPKTLQAGQSQLDRRCRDSPAVAVGGVGVDPELHQKLDDLGVAGADGVVQRRDALVVRRARVVHLQDGRVDTNTLMNRRDLNGDADTTQQKIF